jgi:hypothetical protein
MPKLQLRLVGGFPNVLKSLRSYHLAVPGMVLHFCNKSHVIYFH